jgi:hypothetical protein
MANRFWVGGAGNWSSTGKWSTTSGGASGASVPTSADDAIFDALSGGKFTATVDTAQSVNSLTITPSAGAGVLTISLSARLTTGNLTTTGTAGNNRIWFRGTTYGIAQDFVVNGTVSISDCDFRDIYVRGTAAPISGTRIGDLRGIRGITASTPKTVYWNLAGAQNWSANGWAATSTGSPSTNNFPLAQDIATFTNAGSVTGTITMDAAVPYTGTVDMAGRTSAMTLSIGTTIFVYENWINGSGTTLTGVNTLAFVGRGTQTITSAGKTFSGSLAIECYGGTVQLADALNVGSNSLIISAGTFSTQNYNVSAGVLSSANSEIRTINLGSSTVTLSSASGTTFAITINLTLNAGTSLIVFTSSAAGTRLVSSSATFYDVSFTGTTPNITVAIAGSGTYRNLSFTAPSTTGLIQYTLSANSTITGTLTCAGATVIRRILLRSSVLGTQRDLTVGTLVATDCDFRDIDILGAAAGSAPTRAGDCGGNAGITFPAAKTVYWNLAGAQNWSATAWAPGSGGTPDINNFPLAQDTAVFDNTGSVTGTITIDQDWSIGTFNALARTSAMTLSKGTLAISVYKNWTTGTGVTYSSQSTALVFSGTGTQTITSNGVSFNFPITIQTITGTVQLGDALTVPSGRTFTLTSGTFDAVNYSVTTDIFDTNNSNVRTLKMGSGTWTVTGTGLTVWNAPTSTNFVFYKGTANIVFSSTSTSARTFAGGNQSYNKLTIGGTTGTSTLTITGNNQFTELASTKTVAHTIALGTTTQTFGAWTVTGTAGNVVTLTGTGTSHILAGACTSGIDYLAMGSIGFAATSPGEFYAGANSTGTAAAPVYRTAKPADSTRYWVGGTGNWSDTARWSTSSGGGSGASVPRSHDDVVFDSLSNATAYTATVNAVTGGIRTKALTIAGPLTGNLTLAGATAINGIHGNVTLPATGLTLTYTGAITLSGSATGRTFTTNGQVLGSSIVVNGVGCGWTLGSALDNTAVSADTTITNGAFDTGNYNLSTRSISSNNTNLRTITFGSSTVLSTFSGTASLDFGTNEINRASLVFNSNTSQINFSGVNSGIAGNNQTFYNVSFTSATVLTTTVSGVNTFNNITFTGPTVIGLRDIIFNGNQTINGTLTFSAGTNATMRTFARSDTIGTTRTLTCAAFSGTDADFRDITIAGAAAPVSGTRLGDCKGNSGITFGAGVIRYWNLNAGGDWSAVGWAATSGGTPSVNNFPLAQDTARFEATGLNSGATVTLSRPYNVGTIDMSARTSNTMTLGVSSFGGFIYGNWINGTGTTVIGGAQITYAGRGSQTITSQGKVFENSIQISSPGGSVTLLDAYSTNRDSSPTIDVLSGTFDANGYNVTQSSTLGGIASNGTVTRTVVIGSGTWTIAGTAGWSADFTGLTISGTGTISLTSASAKPFNGGGISYSGITLNQGGAGTLTISGNNTFKSITNTYSATGATTINIGTTTQTLAQPWTAAGAATRVLTVQGTSAASPGSLIFTGSGLAANVDYLAITGVRAYDLTNEWYAGANSTNNGSLGWYFEAGSVIAISVDVSETSTASDSVSAFLTLLSSTSETATASDDIACAVITFIAADLSETSTASDTVSAFLTFLAVTSETTTATDTTASAHSLLAQIADVATGTDAVTTNLSLEASLSEFATGTDVVITTATFNPILSETATGTDAVSTTAVFGAILFETVTAADVTGTANNTFNPSLAETVAATDSLLATPTLLAQVAETAAGTDAVTGGTAFSASLAEFTTGTDAISTTGSVNASLSEAATGTDAVSTTAVFRPSLSETALAQMPTSSTGIFNPRLSETATGTDAVVSVVVMQSQVAEAASGTDVVLGGTAFSSSLAEFATATDTNSARGTFNPALLETATATDVTSTANNTFRVSLAETATGTDAISAASVFNTVLLETVASADAISAVATLRSSLFETIVVTDAILGGSSFTAALSESVTAAGAISTNSTFNLSLAETATSTDAISTTALLNSNLAETATGTDAITTQATLNLSLAEVATGADSTVANLGALSAVAETATATDATQPAIIFVGAIEETATATDLASSLMGFLSQIFESTGITDFALVAPSVFGPQVQEAIAALDLVSTFGTFNVQFVDSATVLDAVIGAYLWNPIDDSQDPSWGVITTPQAPGWGNISASQSPNWATIATPQAPTWTSIDDSQSPNWQNTNNL